jgi:hypothetical protein
MTVFSKRINAKNFPRFKSVLNCYMNSCWHELANFYYVSFKMTALINLIFQCGYISINNWYVIHTFVSVDNQNTNLFDGMFVLFITLFYQRFIFLCNQASVFIILFTIKTALLRCFSFILSILCILLPQLSLKFIDLRDDLGRST